MEEVILKWNGPYRFDNIRRYEVAKANGIYTISRVWGKNESLLYLGITERGFLTRLFEHQEDWLNAVRGTVRVRLGILQFQEDRKFSRKKLEDIEALLINYHRPSENTQSMNYYCGREGLVVFNRGRRGSLRERISTDDFEWV